MRRGGPLRRRRRSRPPEGPLTPLEWELQAYARADYRSQLSGIRVTRVIGEVHHVLPKQWLRANGYHNLVWHLDNAMVLTLSEHRRHEDGSKRIPFDKLPDYALAFACQIQLIGEAALVELERKYPKPKEVVHAEG